MLQTSYFRSHISDVIFQTSYFRRHISDVIPQTSYLIRHSSGVIIQIFGHSGYLHTEKQRLPSSSHGRVDKFSISNLLYRQVWFMGIYPWNKFRYLTCKRSVFSPPERLLHNNKCGGYVPCCATVNTHTIVLWNNSVKCYWRYWHINNITLLTSYEGFQFET